MASTPSASALSAVLRCRGNIWARNPPTKRPAPSAYSLGLTGGAVRDSPAERTRSDQASAWEAFLHGERVVVGRRLAAARKSPRVEGKVSREKESGEIHKVCHPKLSQPPGDAHSSVPGVQSAPVRQLARRLTSNLPGLDKCSQMIKYQTSATHICKIAFVKGTSESELPAGVLKMSITSPCVMGDAGQIPSLVLTGWSSLKTTCLSLTALVSGYMCLKLAVLCRSSCSPDDARQDEKDPRKDALQANGQIHSPTELTSTKDSCEDRPD